MNARQDFPNSSVICRTEIEKTSVPSLASTSPGFPELRTDFSFGATVNRNRDDWPTRSDGLRAHGITVFCEKIRHSLVDIADGPRMIDKQQRYGGVFDHAVKCLLHPRRSRLTHIAR